MSEVKKVAYPVSSLKSMLIDYVASHFQVLLTEADVIERLPRNIKTKLLFKLPLKSICRSSKDDIKLILRCLVHPHMEHINLSNYVVDDDILSVLRVCRYLKNLDLMQLPGSTITTEGLLYLLPCLNELHALSIVNCDAVTDEVVSCIAKNCPKLAALDLLSCKNITNISLWELSHLENLTWIGLSHTKVSNNGVETLIKGPSGKKIKELRLSNCYNLTDEILPSVMINCPSLEVFVFDEGFRIEDMPSYPGLKHIQYTIKW